MNIDMSHVTPEMLAALAAAQGVIENATKGSVNPHFKSRYADLAEVLNTIRSAFPACGLSIVQSTGYDGSLVAVDTAICHASGGYIVATAACVPAKSDAQGIGAATTYLRRYLAAAMCGIAQEDDDGQAASHSRPPQRTQPTAVPPVRQGPSVEDVRSAARAAIERVGRQIVLETMSSLGWSKSDEIPPERRADVMAALGGLQAQEAA
jgi:hypothetical protein